MNRTASSDRMFCPCLELIFNDVFYNKFVRRWLVQAGEEVHLLTPSRFLYHI